MPHTPQLRVEVFSQLFATVTSYSEGNQIVDGQRWLPSESNCKVSLGPPCAVTLFAETWPPTTFGFRQHFADIRHALASLSTPPASIPHFLYFARRLLLDVIPETSALTLPHPTCLYCYNAAWGNNVAHVSGADYWRFCARCLERLLRRGRILARCSSPLPRSSTRRARQSTSQNCRLLTQRSPPRRLRRSGRNYPHQLGHRRPR